MHFFIFFSCDLGNLIVIEGSGNVGCGLSEINVALCFVKNWIKSLIDALKSISKVRVIIFFSSLEF